MKKLLTPFLLISLLFFSCTNNSTSIAPSTTAFIEQGNWKISYFEDNSKDETAKFSGFVFHFSSSGAVSAVSGSTTVNGTWSSGNDDSQDKLYLNFTTSPFDDLSDDWHVVEQSSSTIKLEDVSGGNGGTDYLTFQKL
ncbi:MAG TPA: hypothetical protein PLI68_13850 [Bacteroidia bacterium]|nr:hypothetical protein [Bacteroidia bacterium]